MTVNHCTRHEWRQMRNGCQQFYCIFCRKVEDDAE